jgi:hypothetical protein
VTHYVYKPKRSTLKLYDFMCSSLRFLHIMSHNFFQTFSIFYHSPGTLGKDAVSVTRRRNGCFSLPSAVWRKPLCRVPEKKYSKKKALSMYCVPSLLYRVFLRLCRVLEAAIPVVSSNLRLSWHMVPRKRIREGR